MGKERENISIRPMTKEEYEVFYTELIRAERAPLKNLKKKNCSTPVCL